MQSKNSSRALAFSACLTLLTLFAVLLTPGGPAQAQTYNIPSGTQTVAGDTLSGTVWKTGAGTLNITGTADIANLVVNGGTVNLTESSQLNAWDDNAVQTSGTGSIAVIINGTANVWGDGIEDTKSLDGLRAMVGGALVFTNGQVNTTGSHSRGVVSGGTGSNVTIASSTVSTEGFRSYGMFAFTSSTLSASNVFVNTTGSLAHGVLAMDATASFTNGTVTTTNHGANGLYAESGGKVSATNVIVNVGGDTSSGALSYGTNSFLSLSYGTVTATGSNGGGIGASVNGSLQATGVEIIASGSDQAGIFTRFEGTVNASNVLVSATGTRVFGVRAYSGGTITLTNGTVSATGNAARGVYARDAGSAVAFTTGTVMATGSAAYGFGIAEGGVLSATDIRVTVSGSSSAGINILNSGTASVTRTAFDVTGDLVRASFTSTLPGSVNEVTLDTVSATIGGNLYTGMGSGTTLLTIKSSTLNGAMTTSSSSINNISLQNGSKLSGSSKRNDSSQLNIALSTADTQWQVTGNSTLTNLDNKGSVNMKTSGNTLRTMNLNGNFTQQASGLIAMSLSGTGGMPNALVTVADQTTLAGGLELAGDLSAINNITNGYFVLFNDLDGSKLINGTFATITLNGNLLSLDSSAIAGTQGGGNFTSGGYEYTFTYAGDAASGAVTGGNDVIIRYVGMAVPEPGTWALISGGLSMLIAVQRLRRRF